MGNKQPIAMVIDEDLAMREAIKEVLPNAVLRLFVELGLEDVVDVAGVGGDAIIEDVEVDASCATRVAVTPWLDLGGEEEEGKDGKEDCEGEKESMNVKAMRDMMKIGKKNNVVFEQRG
ncbi:hypothetical protein Ahy_A10g048490 [Arachis hypogaea]|uniref:Uncharacterized protein n=1 Tax=Arachis hypogaea TaxID=3818 RepID=A0A445B590_ARAHY|nr:hypothetical protein Ahy_A10g048490 [Arachis hypogaea]